MLSMHVEGGFDNMDIDLLCDFYPPGSALPT